MTFFYPETHVELVGKSLIVPIVSTANISQLAIDLLISSLSLRRVGIFDARDLIPVVGGREGGEVGITTPLELYGKDGVHILVLQQRSPALKSRKVEFVDSLLTFVQTSGFASVTFLSGVDLSNRTDVQMLTPTYYIYPLNAPPLVSTPLDSLAHLPIPVYNSPVSQHPKYTSEQEGGIPFIPGGGLTRRILSSIPSSWSVPTAALLQFVIEGDNRADANLFAAVVSKVFGVEVTEWKQPGSWKQGLFGAPLDQTLYG